MSKIFGRILFLAIGLIALTFGVSECRRGQSFVGSAVKTQGKVVRYVEMETPTRGRRGGGGTLMTTYAPVVEFAVSNQAFQAHTPTYRADRPYAVGQTVQVLYNPANPFECRIERFANPWRTPLIALGFGLVFLFLSVFGKVRVRQRW